MATIARIIDNPSDAPVSGGYRVDISRGQNISRVSSEWFSRPDDERYLSLTDFTPACAAGPIRQQRGSSRAGRSVSRRAVRILKCSR